MKKLFILAMLAVILTGCGPREGKDGRLNDQIVRHVTYPSEWGHMIGEYEGYDFGFIFSNGIIASLHNDGWVVRYTITPK